MRPSRLERRLDAALAPVRRDLQDLTLAVDDYRADAVVTAASRVADAEQRAAAVSAQAGERVIFAERQAADAVAAVRAELAKVRGESITAGITAVTERAVRAEARVAELERQLEVLTYERDAARFNADTATTDVQSWSESWHVLLGRNRELLAAAGAVLPDLAWGIEHRPRGGTKTKARLRMEHLAAVLDPTDDADYEGAA